MNELKFHRLLERTLKPTYIQQSVHIIECLLVSMQSAVTQIEEEHLDLALAMYAMYLKPFDALVRSHPHYDEYETTYERAVKILATSDLICPCSVCEDDEE